MVKLLGGRAAAAVIGLFMLGVSASAAAQDVAPAAQATATVASNLARHAIARASHAAMIWPTTSLLLWRHP